MAEITASMVKALREQTGLPMMECKKALTETGGDTQAAVDLLRQRGAAAAEKKAGRATGEGRIGSYCDNDKKVAALVEMRCETAPTSNNPEFGEMVQKLAKHVALAGDADVKTLLDEKFVDNQEMTVRDVIQDTLNKIRENMLVACAVRVEGRSGIYVHHNGRVAAIVTVEGDGGDDDLLSDFCKHVVAMNPDVCLREEMSADEVEKEKAILKQQIIDSGKPENLVDKILEGKINRWFSERVFVEQPFVKDDKQTVAQAAKAAGLTIKSFVRIQVGETEIEQQAPAE